MLPVRHASKPSPEWGLSMPGSTGEPSIGWRGRAERKVLLEMKADPKGGGPRGQAADTNLGFSEYGPVP